MKKLLSKKAIAAIAVCGMIGLLNACGGSDTAAITPPPATPGDGSPAGLALPSEISAVSDNDSGAASFAASLKGMAAAAVADLPVDSDYENAKTFKFVDEKTLEVFGIVETILNAVSQTNYADPENVNGEPYKAMVAWDEEMEGNTQKTFEEWVVQSEMTTEDGAAVNIVSIWMADDEEETKAQIKIYAAPTLDSTGKYTDYGRWKINAVFADAATDEAMGSFYADADIDANGMTVLQLKENFTEEEDIDGTAVVLTGTTKAVMHRSAAAGYGKVILPDWGYCWDFDQETGVSPCVGGGEIDLNTAETIKYAYNPTYLSYQQLDKDGAVTETVHRDRTKKSEIAYRYGVFDGTTGADVLKSKAFGFPVRYTTAAGATGHGYYGAWQGRHQLWAGSASLPSGTNVTREDRGPNDASPTYTTRTFDGALTKRLLTAADISQIKGIPVETWLGNDFMIIYNGAAWEKCNHEDVIWGGESISCGSDTPVTFDIATLAVEPDSRKSVNINRWTGQENFNYFYDDQQNGFVETDQSGGMAGEPYTPVAGDILNIWVGGSTYIEYTGDFTNGSSGWVEKNLTDFDETTWTPVFAAGGSAFDFPVDAHREYYINNKGVNFVVKRTADFGVAADYQVKMEIQQVVNPTNASELTKDWTFKEPWNDANQDAVTYRLNTTAGDPNYLLLEYAVPDLNNNKAVGDLVTKDIWGLAAYAAGGASVSANGNPVQFNWEYAENERDWGRITYLLDGSGYILLDDPLMFDPITLTNLAGTEQLYSLQFDGWMHGLPDMHWELEKAGYVLSPDIKDKIVNIPAGTEVTDSAANSYYIKPLEIGVLLETVADPGTAGPDLNAADGIDLESLPAASVDMGAVPAASLKYVEGKLVQ